MDDRLAINVRVAAFRLFEEGRTLKEVQAIFDNLAQPTPGYVYIDELPAPKINF